MNRFNFAQIVQIEIVLVERIALRSSSDRVIFCSSRNRNYILNNSDDSLAKYRFLICTWSVMKTRAVCLAERSCRDLSRRFGSCPCSEHLFAFPKRS